MRRLAALGAAAVVAVVAGCMAWQPRPVASPPAGAPRIEAAAAGSVTGAGLLPAQAPTPIAAGGAALPASLQGTEADGGWRADAQGRLVVDRALRRRFDYWLSAVGEWQPDEIGVRLLASARQELPPAALGQLQALWAGYVALQRHPWQRAALPAEPSTWRAALEERQAVRLQRLGREGAYAFFAEEEQALWGEILAWESGQGAATQAQAPQLPEHPQAAQRVAEVEAQWALWERRLDEARHEMVRLQAAPELSGHQREQAVQAWLAQHFSGAEQPRVRAVLGLAPAPGA